MARSEFYQDHLGRFGRQLLDKQRPKAKPGTVSDPITRIKFSLYSGLCLEASFNPNYRRSPVLSAEFERCGVLFDQAKDDIFCSMFTATTVKPWQYPALYRMKHLEAQARYIDHFYNMVNDNADIDPDDGGLAREMSCHNRLINDYDHTRDASKHRLIPRLIVAFSKNKWLMNKLAHEALGDLEVIANALDRKGMADICAFTTPQKPFDLDLQQIDMALLYERNGDLSLTPRETELVWQNIQTDPVESPDTEEEDSYQHRKAAVLNRIVMQC